MESDTLRSERVFQRQATPPMAIMAAPYLLWAVVALGALLLRPPTAPIELETLASAWHMYVLDRWVPLRNNQEIPFLPPFHLWLILAGWKLFGPVLWWPRILSAFASLSTIFLTGRLAALLWPSWPLAPQFARLLLCGLGGFVVSATLIQPEIISLPFLCMALIVIIRQWQMRNRSSLAWLLFGVVLAVLALEAGWPLSLSLLVLAFAAPMIGHESKSALALGSWYGWVTTAGLLGLAPAALWASHFHVFASYGDFWQDPSTEAMRREPWTLLLLPVMLYPWITWPTLWRALTGHLKRRWGASFAFGVAMLVVLFFACLATGTQLQGMLPLVIPLTLVGARLLSRVRVTPRDFHAAAPGLLALLFGMIFFLINIVPTAHLDALWRQYFGVSLPIWMGGIGLVSGIILLVTGYLLAQFSPNHQLTRTLQVACLPVVLITCINLEFPSNLAPFFDLAPVGARLAVLQQAGRPLAIYGTYRGEFDYWGHLDIAPDILPTPLAAVQWSIAHPDGAFLTYFTGSPIRLPALPYYRGVARDRWIAIWPASAIGETGGKVLDDRY
jgi:hypothetical protein